MGNPLLTNSDIGLDQCYCYRGFGISEPLINQVTIPQVLENLLESQQSNLALTWYGVDGDIQRFTYKELIYQIKALAYWFVSEQRVTRGDRVVVLSSNCPEAFVTHIALMSIGAVTVPVNNAESQRVLKLIIDKVQPRVVVSGRDLSPEISFSTNALVQLPQLPIVLTIDDFLWPSQEIHHNDPAVILFTSGTTSEPKGVCLSHYNLLVNAEGLSRTHHHCEHRVHMCVMPLFHANAFGFSMIGSIYAGNHVVLCSGIPGISFWSILRTEQVDIVSLAPEIIRVLSQIPVPRETLPALKYVVSAAAPLTKMVANEFIEKTGIDIHQGYGLSECVNFAATIPWHITNEKLQQTLNNWSVPSIGPALFGCDIDVRKADGSKAQLEEEGEIVVSGHTLMLGYWDTEKATEATIGNGVLCTGDLGFFSLIDGERYFFITGRKKEIVIRYGENLSPLAIEAELAALRSIGRYAVTGFANESAGEEIGLYILAHSTLENENKIMNIVRSCPERYRPRIIIFGNTSIPATPTGKIKRSLLAEYFNPYRYKSFGSDPIIGKTAY